MKKFLLTATLVLALVVSLTAGTMAYYEQRVATIEAAITTKEFSIIADKKSESFSQTIEIAPGDTARYKVRVDNASEVLTDVTVAAELSIVYEGMSVLVEYLPGSEKNLVLESTDPYTIVRMGEGEYGEFLITVAWDYATGNANDNNKSTTLSIDIYGRQYNSANVIDETQTLAH